MRWGRWRGSWALSALRRVSRRTSGLVGDAERLFLAHDRAFQLGARFLPELNPVAAAFAGTTGVGLRRFLVGGAATATVWAGTWIAAGYVIGGATRDGDLPGTVCLAVALVLSAAATLGLAIPAAVRAIAALWSRSPVVTASRGETPPGGAR